MAKDFIDFVSHIKKPQFETIQKVEDGHFKKFHEDPEITELRRRHEKEIKQASEASYQIGYQNAMNEAQEKYGQQVAKLQDIVNGMVGKIHTEKRKMAEKTRELFPEVVWQLIQLFFVENQEVFSKSLLSRIDHALNSLLSEAGCELHLNPADVGLVSENLKIPGIAIDIIANQRIPIGSFQMKAGYSEIDGDIMGFLQRIKENA